MTKNAILPFLCAALLISVPAASASETSSGSLDVTGTIESSISLTVESAGGTTSGTGNGAASSALGGVGKYDAGSISGFTKARGASDWTLSATIGVKVEKANLTSTDYTLTAELGSAPAVGVTWKLNGSTLSDSAPTTLTSTGSYGDTGTYSWDIVVTDSATASAIDNVINFGVTSN